MRMTAPDPANPVPLEDIDLYDPERFRSSSQHPAWATLRREAPLWQQELPNGARFWSLTRYADVVNVLKDTKRFSSEHGTILAVIKGDIAGGKTINLMDPPEHTWVRVPTIRLMSTEVLKRLTPRIKENVLRVVEPVFDGGKVDFAQLMFDLPMAAVGEILGIPREYWSDIPRWTIAGVAPEDPEFSRGSYEETLRYAHYQLFSMFSELIAERRRNPGDDLTSTLLQLDFGGRRMTENEVLLNCYSFVMGANTTTPEAGSQLLLAFLEHPEAWAKVKADPRLVDSVIEETLRWSTPTNHLLRRTREEVELYGRRIPAGELVCAWVASANRDERVFADPYVFDPARSPNPHIGFGIGPHYCIGGPAARVALIQLLRELVARVDHFEQLDDATHLYSNFINGITHLPVVAHLDGGKVATA